MAAAERAKKQKGSSIASFKTSTRNAGLGKNQPKSKEMSGSPSNEESMQSGSKLRSMSRVVVGAARL